MRIGLTYQGHVAYEFTASMGDVVFAPLYEVCRKNGVRFEFFHRVEEVIAERPPRWEAPHHAGCASAARWI